MTTVSDSNHIQFWPIGEGTFNDKQIPFIRKNLYFQPILAADTIKVEIKPDQANAPTWSPATSYNIGDLVYSTFTGLRYRSTIDANLNNDPTVAGVNWTFDIPGSLGAWSNVISYNTGDVVTVTTSFGFFSNLIYKWKSLNDANLGNVPIAGSTHWIIVMENPSNFILVGYIDGSSWNQFIFENIRIGSPNQKTSFDVAFFPELFRKYLKLMIFSGTTPVSVGIPSLWNDLVSAWTFKNATQFIKNGLATGGINIRSYQPMFASQGSVVTIRYRMTVVNGFLGNVGVSFYASTGLGAIVSTNSFDVTPDLHAPGTLTVTETLTLTADCTRLVIVLNGLITTASINVTVDQLVGVSVPNAGLFESDCLDVRESFADNINGIDSSLAIRYTNLRDFDGLAYQNASQVNTLRLIAGFWETDERSVTEDLNQSDGSIASLRDEIKQLIKLDTDMLPGYMRLKLKKILMHNYVQVAGVIIKREEDYQNSPIDRYTLSKLVVWLTIQDSVLVNIGGNVVLSDHVFSDEFSHPPFA